MKSLVCCDGNFRCSPYQVRTGQDRREENEGRCAHLILFPPTRPRFLLITVYPTHPPTPNNPSSRQPNNSPGCSFAAACPTLGSADPASPFHGKRGVKDDTYPQTDQAIRFSSSFPDWPMPTTGGNYAEIYKKSTPSAYSWQYNDGSNSLFVCCGAPDRSAPKGSGGPLGTPHYKITFCP